MTRKERRTRALRVIEGFALHWVVFEAIKTIIRAFPGLAWVKRYDERRRAYVMLAFSEKYERDIVGPHANDYLGHTDFEFHAVEYARVFWQRDEEVRLQGGRFVGEEYESKLHPGRVYTCYCWKWSVVIAGVTYLFGIGEGIPKRASTSKGS